MNEAIMAFRGTLEFANRRYKSLLRPEFGEYSTMYTFTTENLSGYLKQMQIKDKKVLTVTASGDQLINLALCGAYSISNFDSNKNAYYITMLKIAALKALTYEEFVSYFTSCDDKVIDRLGTLLVPIEVNENRDYLSYDLYLKIRSYLSSDVVCYFDSLYHEYNNSGANLNASGLFFNTSRRDAIDNNIYLANDNNYYKAREQMEKISYNFYCCDVYQIHRIPEKYDIVFLSNIYDYVTKEKYTDNVDNSIYIQYVKEGLNDILNPNAEIAVTYQYHYRERNNANRSALQKLFGKGKYIVASKPELDKYKFKKIIINASLGIYKHSEDDCLYIYEKGKNK